MKLCIDLFSGLGGFSEAFLQRGWKVIRIDNDQRFREVPDTIIGNIQHLPLKHDIRPDILLISPPCNCFSVASIGKHWKDQFPDEETVQSIKLVMMALHIADKLKPRYWVLENPRGMLRRVLGKPQVTTYFASWGEPRLKPTDLWGKLPEMDFPEPEKWERAPRGSKRGTQRIQDPAERSKIPYALSEALAIATEKEIA